MRCAIDGGYGAEQALQRMPGLDVGGPVGEHHEAAVVDQPTHKPTEHVERGVVGPVRVLHHEDGGSVVAEQAAQRAQ